MISSAELAVLLALVRVHEQHGRATVSDVARARGLRSVSTTHAHLVALRDEGFVTWDTGKAGTLRPLVRSVPFGVGVAGVHSTGSTSRTA